MLKKLMMMAVAGMLATAGQDANAVERLTVGNTQLVVETVMGTIEADIRHLRMADDVYHNELIETQEASATEIMFLDDTKLALGPNSSLTLDQFVYNPDPALATFVVTATKGVFRFVSGTLPKDSYTIHTPTATIGVRGTVLTVVVLPVDLSGGQFSVNIAIEEGVAEVTDCQGRSVVLDRSGLSTTVAGSLGGTCSPPTQPGPRPNEFTLHVANLDSLISSAQSVPN